MRPTLRAFFDVDNDSTGELWIEVAAGRFAGVSSAWFGVNDLLEFARTLAVSYPLSAANPISLTGGFWSKTGVVVEQPHVSLSFYPVGSRGTVGCKVQRATPLRVEDRPAHQSRLELELLTTYEAVRTFARGLAAIVHNQAKEALLECAEG
jgi:hypothetical protein